MYIHIMPCVLNDKNTKYILSVKFKIIAYYHIKDIWLWVYLGLWEVARRVFSICLSMINVI